MHKLEESGKNDILKNLKYARENGTKDSSTLNREYQKLENEAYQNMWAEFFLERGEFYYTSAKQASKSDHILLNILYTKALQDYHQALNFDPFVKNVTVKIEEIVKAKEQLANSPIVKKLERFTNSNSVGASPYILLSAPQFTKNLSRREELKPEVLGERYESFHGNPTNKS